MWDDPSIGVDIIRSTTAFECNHAWSSDRVNMMLVLVLPPSASLQNDPQAYSITELLEHTFQEFSVVDLECAVCLLRSQSGWVRFNFSTPLPAVIAMRANRYDDANRRRSDFVRPESSRYLYKMKNTNSLPSSSI